MREFLLMKRNSFIYVLKSIQVSSYMLLNFPCIIYFYAAMLYLKISLILSLQLVIVASICMTVLLRTRMGVDEIHANYYMGALFYALVILVVDGVPELQMTTSRLAVFYKQRELYFYPAWAYAIPAAILKVPLSLMEAFVWTALTYYVIGYSPELER
jgi:hypothetical protein